MAKSGIINPQTGRDYLECQLAKLSPAEQLSATVFTVAAVQTELHRENLKKVSETARELGQAEGELKGIRYMQRAFRRTFGI